MIDDLQVASELKQKTKSEWMN